MIASKAFPGAIISISSSIEETVLVPTGTSRIEYLRAIGGPDESADRLVHVRRDFFLRIDEPHPLCHQLALQLQDIVGLDRFVLADKLYRPRHRKGF